VHLYPLLSERELEIVLHRVKGESLKGIAGELDISLSTVKSHMQRIFLKLKIQSSIQLLQRLQDDCATSPNGRAARKCKDAGLRMANVYVLKV
jgi:DNA-binding CsgD family transcriptional regulator